MVDSLAVDAASLVGVIMQAFCYGVYQVLFFGCLYVLLYIRGSERINWQMVSTVLVMWILITINFALSWSRIMDAFIVLQPTLQQDPEAIVKYFDNLGHWKEVARTAAYISLTAVADSLFIYRCYVVWGRNKYVIILPLILLCCSITSGIGIEVVISTASSSTDVLFSTALASWATTFFSISLIQNVLTTFLIVYRIWRVNIGVSGLSRNHSLWPVMAVILESGAIYSSILLVLLVTYESGSFSQYIALDMLVPIIGIVFNLIIVRVGLGLSKTSTPRNAQSTTLEPSAIYFRTVKNSVNVSVSRHVTVDENISIRTGPTTTGDRYGDTRDDVSDVVHIDPWKLPAEAV